MHLGGKCTISVSQIKLTISWLSTVYGIGILNCQWLIAQLVTSNSLDQNQILQGNKLGCFEIYSRLSRSNTARGSFTGLVTLGPNRYKASKSVLFTNDPSIDKRKNTC